MRSLTTKILIYLTVTLTVTHLLVSTIEITPRKNFSPCHFNHLEHHIDDYNVLFVGSSRFGRQIDPEYFDSLNKASEYSSYNYSFDAAFAPTSLNLALQALSLEPSNLKFLILELLRWNSPGG